MSDKIVDLFGNATTPEEDAVPNNNYRIFLKPGPNGAREPINVTGYLALTGSFFAVAQGERGGDIKFVAPVESIDYITEFPSMDLTVN